MKPNRLWLVYALVTTLAWGVWGAFIDLPNQAGFPETLGYVVWSLTMVPPAVVALWLAGWKLEHDGRSVLLGCAAGFLGAGGQLILFKTVSIAPAWLVFPFIALSPLVTIVLAAAISREQVGMKGWVGIVLALAAGVLLSTGQQESFSGYLWVVLALLVLMAWGLQGFVISYANESMRAESIFFYMMSTGLLLAPFAVAMTDFRQDINWGWNGPYLAAAIQLLNSIGALLLVYAFRYGKAMIVAPLINAGAPALTTVISLGLATFAAEPIDPPPIKYLGITLAIVAAVLMAIEEEEDLLNEEKV